MQISDTPPEATTLEFVEAELVKSTHQIESLSQRIDNHRKTADELVVARDKWIAYNNKLTSDVLKLRGV